jgi:hypothetical protein
MKNLFYTLLAVLAFAGCGKNSGSDNTATTASPEKAVLLFPSQNSVCVTGNTISTTQSAVTLTWSPAANTESYEVGIKNLLNSVLVTQATTTNQLTVTLLSSTPYSWYVISKSSKTALTAQSDTWKFYNSGLGNTYYSPFPADLISPRLNSSVTASNGTIRLLWSGSDPDNDITSYDVYMSTTSTNLSMIKSGVTDMFLNGVSATPGSLYYWKVVTTDAHGNASDSPVYNFLVQ